MKYIKIFLRNGSFSSDYREKNEKIELPKGCHNGKKSQRLRL